MNSERLTRLGFLRDERTDKNAYSMSDKGGEIVLDIVENKEFWVTVISKENGRGQTINVSGVDEFVSLALALKFPVKKA